MNFKNKTNNSCRKSALVLLLFLTFYNAKSQDSIHIHLPGYNDKTFHLGCYIAINSVDFVIKTSPGLQRFDSLKSISSYPLTGFDLGIISELKLTKYLKLRFVPSLGFLEQEIQYTFVGVKSFTKPETIQSVFLNLPVDIKLISPRLKNIDGYILCGMNYTSDLAAQHATNQTIDTAFLIHIYRSDFYYEGGGGIDFYFHYFKFAIEFKFSQGLRNLIIPDNTIYTQSIQALYSRIYLVSFTIEGNK